MRFFLIYTILTILINTEAYSQNLSTIDAHAPTYFISLNYGIQMSGIKDEDFVSSNYSPLFNITAGKWFTQLFSIQIGYKGFYFNAIADDFKHHYNYFYAEAIINLNNFVDSDRENRIWNLLLHAGPGYFYNHLYERASLHFNIGIQNTFQLSDHFHASIDIASIVGWDIYQGDEDILPGITIGLTYNFLAE